MSEGEEVTECQCRHCWQNFPVNRTDCSCVAEQRGKQTGAWEFVRIHEIIHLQFFLQLNWQGTTVGAAGLQEMFCALHWVGVQGAHVPCICKRQELAAAVGVGFNGVAAFFWIHGFCFDIAPLPSPLMQRPEPGSVILQLHSPLGFKRLFT